MKLQNVRQPDGTRRDVFLDGDAFFVGDFPDPSELLFLPGLADVHVHLREPGFCYKETIATGTAAAAAGGYTAVCAMPNLDPAPDDLPRLQVELDAIAAGARVPVYPFGCITAGEKGRTLAAFEALAPFVVGFSDDGVGVADDDLMEAALRAAKAVDRPIAAHCEVLSLVRGGCVHDGRFARAHGLPGICSESEWRMVQRDLKLVAKTGARYHVCHVSTKESVALVREAKRAGLPVTCETAPHYLTLTEDDLIDDGRFKMNPPVREMADREALREGLSDGTVDCVATDHAPHAAAEKALGLSGSKMGVVGLETALPVLYTELVRPGLISLERLIDAMSARPRAIFRLPDEGGWSLFDPNARYAVDPTAFRSMGRATPFAGREVFGRTRLTAVGTKAVYSYQKCGE